MIEEDIVEEEDEKKESNSVLSVIDQDVEVNSETSSDNISDKSFISSSTFNESLDTKLFLAKIISLPIEEEEEESNLNSNSNNYIEEEEYLLSDYIPENLEDDFPKNRIRSKSHYVSMYQIQRAPKLKPLVINEYIKPLKLCTKTFGDSGQRRNKTINYKIMNDFQKNIIDSKSCNDKDSMSDFLLMEYDTEKTTPNLVDLNLNDLSDCRKKMKIIRSSINEKVLNEYENILNIWNYFNKDDDDDELFNIKSKNTINTNKINIINNYINTTTSDMNNNKIDFTNSQKSDKNKINGVINNGKSILSKGEKKKRVKFWSKHIKEEKRENYKLNKNNSLRNKSFGYIEKIKENNKSTTNNNQNINMKDGDNMDNKNNINKEVNQPHKGLFILGILERAVNEKKGRKSANPAGNFNKGYI